jgi:hypothetical protein
MVAVFFETCCKKAQKTQRLVRRAMGSSRRSYAQAVAGLPMQNSFSTLRDESDNVLLGAEFLDTDGASPRATGGRAPRKRSRLRSTEGTF